MSAVLDYDPDNLAVRQRDGRKRIFREACLRELHAADGDRAKIAEIAAKVVQLATMGDMRAVEFLADRIDGKVPQAVTGEDGAPIAMEVIRRVIVEHTGETAVSSRDARLIEGGEND